MVCGGDDLFYLVEIRRITVSPSDDQAELLPAEPVKSSLPIEAEEDDTDDKVSRGSYKPVLHYNAAVEVFEKPEYTSAGEEGSAGITIPRTIGLLGAVSFIVGTILGLSFLLQFKPPVDYSKGIVGTKAADLGSRTVVI